jgi:ElaB/YqjD/DUF883 family membrane-anchored ribosome-binding protein
MEVYYQNLISEENSLEKLVADLSFLGENAEEIASAATGALPKAEVLTRLERLKRTGERLKAHIVAGSKATDRTLHAYPYSAAGFAFAAGLLAGVLAKRLAR